MVFIKRVNNSDGGSATRWGGNDLDNIDKLFDDVDIEAITGKPVRINTKWEFRDGELYQWNTANSFKYRLRPGTLGANVDVFLPNLSANGTLVAAGGANDWGSALQTFRHNFLVLRNPANTASYTVNTSAIIANRNISIPLLTTDDFFVFRDFIEELKNKTFHINLNTIKHSTTNAQGDIYKYDTTSGKLIRVARGTAGQVLKVNAGGTDIEWGTDATGGGGAADADKVKVYEAGVQVGTVARELNFNGTDFNVTENAGADSFDISLASPGGGGSGTNFYDELKTSSGFKYGTYTGDPNLSGYGTLASLHGFDVQGSAYFNSTFGTASSWTISGASAVGWATWFPVTQLQLNPDLTIAFMVDHSGDNAGNRFYAGFASTDAVTLDSSFLDDLSGFLLFKHSDDSFWQIAHNNGSGTMVESGSVLSADSTFHTIRLVGDPSVPRFQYSIDGGALTAITSEIPSTTAQLHVVFNGSDNDTTTREQRCFWAKMKQKERP